MAYTPASPVPAARKRGPATYVAIGCGLIALCMLCAAGAGGGYWYLYLRPTPTTAGEPTVEYILDASPRMAQQAQGETVTRLSVARGVLAEIVRPSDPAVTAGLRVFGTGAQPDACSDTSLLVPLARATQGTISNHLLSINTGSNPAAAMAQAMVSAIRDISPTKGPHTLVVVTGGADSCSPQAGDLIAAEAKKAGIDLQMFVVGYQVSTGDGDAIKGLVDSAGGTYVKADSKDELSKVLGSIQQYVDRKNAVTVSSVLATAAAAVGTANVTAGSTPTAPAGTIVPGNIATPTTEVTPSSGSTAEATTAATAAATVGGSGTGGTGQTACDHPYFPMRSGSTWAFTSSQGNTTWTVTGVTGTQTDATATMEFATKDVTGTYHWHCTPDGIVSYDFGNIAGATGTTVDFKVTHSSGVWLPTADKLTTGATWQDAYTLEYSASGITFSDATDQHFTLAGTEPQTVLGQKRDALHITSTATSQVTAGGQGTGSINTSSEYWLVRGIGPVHIVSQFDTSTYESTLSSYSIP